MILPHDYINMTVDERLGAGLPGYPGEGDTVEAPRGFGYSAPMTGPQFWRDEDFGLRNFYADMQGRRFRTLDDLNRANGTNYTDSDISQQSYSQQRGNAGHGSWLDQQGGDILGDALFAGAGYASGGTSQLLINALGFGGDTAEGQRQDRAGALGGVAANVSGGSTSTDSSYTSDASTTDYNGSTGSSTLQGGSGSDTLGGDTTAGGSTDNYFGDYLNDPNTGDVSSSNSDPYGTGVDSNGNPTGQYSDSTFQGDTTNTGYSYESDPNYTQLAKQYGPTIAKQILARNGGGKQTLGQSILGQVGSDPLSAGFSALPFILALNEANRQGGDINDTIGRMRTLEDSVSGNASPYMKALLDPYDMQTGTGRTALMQDQTLRGVRGSSFGDQSLENYDYTRGVGRADIGSKALLGSAGLQGNLLGSELGAINARNTNRNLLLGAGLSASGKLFQPEKDPFNLNTLLGLS